MVVKQGKGHTSCDEFFARAQVGGRRGFVFVVEGGKPDYGTVSVGRRILEVTDVEVWEDKDELTELLVTYPAGREPVYLLGRRRRV